MKSLIFAEGNGYGHVARDRLLSRELDLPIITYGKGAEFCRREGIEFTEIPSPYVIQSGKEKVRIVTDVKEIMNLIKPEVISTLRKRFSEVDLVIVDGSPLGIVAAMMMRKRVLFITNDTSSLVGIYGSLQKQFAASLQSQLFKYIDTILVPDFPAPLAITSRNIDIRLPIRFIGPLVTRTKQEKHTKKIVVSGNLRNEIEPLLRERAVYGSREHGIERYMQSAQVVIGHGGHSSIMESLCHGKPIICIADQAYSERYNNAITLEKNNVGALLEHRLLSAECLDAAISYCETLDKKRLALYERWGSKLDAVSQVREIIETKTSQGAH